MLYEINFLILQSKTVDLEKIRKETKKFIESFKAEIVEEKEYLKRKLAYEIQHENYGFFTVLRFKFKGAKNLDELKNKLNQRTEIARYIIVKAENLPSLEEQDAKAQEKDQDEIKSIKSEDVEKVLTEQKKAETKKEDKKEEKPKKKAIVKKKETTVVAEKKEVEKVEETPKKKPVIKEEANSEKEAEPAKGKEIEEDSKKKTESKEKVSLDELDKKLDEILNS